MHSLSGEHFVSHPASADALAKANGQPAPNNHLSEAWRAVGGRCNSPRVSLAAVLNLQGHVHDLVLLATLQEMQLSISTDLAGAVMCQWHAPGA